MASTQSGDTALRTVGLRKSYGSRVAVEGLDLEVQTGSVCGLLGPNGAGKTTTMRMLLGLTRPSDGTAEVLGAPAGSVRALERVDADGHWVDAALPPPAITPIAG